MSHTAAHTKAVKAFGPRVFLTLVLTVIGIAPVTSAQASAPAQAKASAAAATAASPVGTWTLSVTVEGIPPFPAKFHFISNGILLVAGRGSGIWYSTGGNTYAFRAAEGNFDPDGTYTGWLDVSQSFVLSGDTFTSSGVTKVYDANDTFVVNANVTLTATRD